MARALGVAIFALAALAALSLATWSANDPSLTHLSTAKTSNALGAIGAIFADLVMTSLGIAGMIALLPPLYWACRLTAGQVVPRFKTKLILAPFAVLASAAFLSSLPRTALWPLLSGYGGNLGDVALSALTSLAVQTSTERAGLLAAVVALAAGLSLMTLALGLTRDDLRAMAQFAKRPFEPDSSWVAQLKANVSSHTPMHTPMPAAPINAATSAAGEFALPPLSLTPETTDAWTSHHGVHTHGIVDAPMRCAAHDTSSAQRVAIAPVAVDAHAVAPPLPPAPVIAAAPEPVAPSAPPRLIHRLPPTSLLAKTSTMRATALEMSIAEKLRADRLKDVLAAFAVSGEIREHLTGPVVTTFLFEPQTGTKMARILGLGDEIARSLGVSGIRMQLGAGRASLIIEVPHDDAIAIGLRDLVEHPTFRDSATRLPLAIGSTARGEPAIMDLAHLPALLVTGGSRDERAGLLRALVGGLAYRHTAERLTLAVADTAETLGALAALPHCEGHAPAVGVEDALRLLAWAAEEIDARTLRLRTNAHARSIEAYNAHTVTPMPYLVVAVDNLAALAEREEPGLDYALHRIVRDGTAVGVHLIAASARTDERALPEAVRAIFATRLALKVPTRPESRAVLGETGAENLLGQGDALVVTNRDDVRRALGGGALSRVHATRLSLDDAAAIMTAAQPLVEAPHAAATARTRAA